MSDIVKLSIPGNPEYIRIAQMAMRSAAAQMGFDVEQISDIEIAVGEACKNVTCHNFDEWCVSYDICWEPLDGKAEITVCVGDSGRGTAKGKTKPCVDCPKEGNLSIAIINSIMNEVEFFPDGKGNKCIRMIKEI